MSHRWRRVWSIRAFFSEVVLKSLARWQFSSLLIGALTCFAPSASAVEISDFTDITIRTGFQLKEEFSKLEIEPNVQTALQYLAKAENRSLPEFGGLAQISFRHVKMSPADKFQLFIIPFYEPGNQQTKHLIVRAFRPKEGDSEAATKVLLGTVSTEIKPAEVKQENVVVDGKVQPGTGSLKSWFKCSIGACAPAGLGCLYGAPAWVPCFCLWCGGGVISCGLLELFFP